MHGAFRPLVNPPSPVNEIDIESTREDRDRVRNEWARRQQLAEMLLDPECPRPD